MIKNINVNLGIGKIIASTILITIFISFVLGYFFVLEQSSLLKDFIRNRNVLLANSLVRTSEAGFLYSNDGRNERYIAQTDFIYSVLKNVLNEPDIVYSAIYDKNGIPVATKTIYNKDLENYVSSTPIESTAVQNLVKNETKEEIAKILNFGKVLDIVEPIVITSYTSSISTKKEKDIIVGAIRLGVNLNSIKEQTQKLIINIIKITVILILIMFIGIILLLLASYTLFKTKHS